MTKSFDLDAELLYSCASLPTSRHITPSHEVNFLLSSCTGRYDWGAILTGKKILEVGAGECSFIPRILEVSKPEKYIATDVFFERMKFARQNINNPVVEFKQANILSLSFETGYFDAVLAFGILHHIPNLQDALGEIARVLTPGGLLIFRDPCSENPLVWLKFKIMRHSKNEAPLSRRVVKRLFAISGLRIINLRKFWFRFPKLPQGPWSVNIGGMAIKGE